LEGTVEDLADLAARAQSSERSLFEAEGRAENAVRRAELMDGELMSTRGEVDRLRTRVVELEASLRRALAEVLVPSALNALGFGEDEPQPDRGEGTMPVATAAVRSAKTVSVGTSNTQSRSQFHRACCGHSCQQKLESVAPWIWARRTNQDDSCSSGSGLRWKLMASRSLSVATSPARSICAT